MLISCPEVFGLHGGSSVLQALREKGRLSAELDSANATIEAQNHEIAKLRDALRASADCVRELCMCLDQAMPWIDPFMIGPVTETGATVQAQLLQRIDEALVWAGHRKPRA